MDFCTSKGRKRNSTRSAGCCRAEDFAVAEQSLRAASLHPGKGGMAQWLEQGMHPRESGEGWKRAALVLWRVINSLPRKHFEMCYKSAEDYSGNCHQLPGLEGQELKATGSPVLCLQPCPCSTGNPFLKVWKGIVCKLFPEPPNQAASRVLTLLRTHRIRQDQALLVSLSLPSSA